MNKRGLSEIIVSLILVVITILSVVAVGVVVNNLISKNVQKSESCFGNFGKVTLDERYVCYNDDKKVQFSINMGDVDVSGVLVSVSTIAGANPFTITNENQAILGLTYFDGSSPVMIPPKNGARTYFYDIGERPNIIQIAPIISGTQCEVSDSVTDIDDC